MVRYSTKTSGINKVWYLYNPSDGLLRDAYEFAVQKVAEHDAAFAEEFLAVGLAALGLESPLSNADQMAVRQVVAKRIVASLPQETQDLVASFAARVFTESLSQNIQAILVPHSQGNMFANSVVDNLSLIAPANLSRGLGVVNIANPAGRTPSNLYVTNTRDTVINVLSAAAAFVIGAAQPMTPNFDASDVVTSRDSLGHGFNEVYMATDLPNTTNSIAAAIVAKIDSAMYRTSTFIDSPSFIFDANGNKIAKPSWYPADSTSVMVCFPGAVGGS
jgi:hypothetical protein